MNDSINRIRAVQVKAAEEAAIASIPSDLRENMRKAKEAFKASGGCKGCGSQLIAVHYWQCPTLANDLY